MVENLRHESPLNVCYRMIFIKMDINFIIFTIIMSLKKFIKNRRELNGMVIRNRGCMGYCLWI